MKAYEDGFLTGCIFLFLLGALLGFLLFGAAGCGPAAGVRGVTACVTYDHALQRPDPTSGVSRDAAGASVCVEAGPRE